MQGKAIEASIQMYNRDLEIGTQSQDSENVQRNLEIAQIPRLRGTYICDDRY